MTLCIITWRAGVAIDMLIRLRVCCAYVTKSTKPVLWIYTSVEAEIFNLYKREEAIVCVLSLNSCILLACSNG